MDIEYLYHVQNVTTDHGQLPILSAGIVYAKSLEKSGTLSKIMQYEKDRPEAYLEHLRGVYRGIINQQRRPYATYYFSGLDGACLSQAQTLRNSTSTFDNRGRIIEQETPHKTSMSLPIIARVHRKNMPPGTYFPDPFTFDSPKAVLHLIAEDHNRVVISPEFIEISIGDRFVPALEIDLDGVMNMIENRDVRALIQRILPPEN